MLFIPYLIVWYRCLLMTWAFACFSACPGNISNFHRLFRFFFLKMFKVFWWTDCSPHCWGKWKHCWNRVNCKNKQYFSCHLWPQWRDVGVVFTNNSFDYFCTSIFFRFFFILFMWTITVLYTKGVCWKFKEKKYDSMHTIYA